MGRVYADVDVHVDVYSITGSVSLKNPDSQYYLKYKETEVRSSLPVEKNGGHG